MVEGEKPAKISDHEMIEKYHAYSWSGEHRRIGKDRQTDKLLDKHLHSCKQNLHIERKTTRR